MHPSAALLQAMRRGPDWTVRYLVALRKRRALASPRDLESARRQMEFLLGETRPEIGIDEVAARHIEHRLWCREMRWHPNMAVRQPVEGVAHLVEAHRRHGGVILNFMHHGYFDGRFASLQRVGAPMPTVAAASEFYAADAPAYQRQNFKIYSMGCIPIDVSVGMKGLLEVIEDGKVLGIASDVPGSTPVTFVGRQLLGSSGAARIAKMTNSPVVLMTSHRTDGGGHTIRLSPPLDPGSFESPEDLLHEMLSRHEEAILAWPEAADWPRTRWTHLDHDGIPLPRETADLSASS